MREILFKAKRLYNGEWVEGWLCQNEVGQISIQPKDESCWFVIDPETICQFTGLTDNNGNKIWENDIVNGVESAIDGFEHCFKVKVDFDFMHLTRIEYSNDIEVIGNIFDNPELLKGGNNE